MRGTAFYNRNNFFRPREKESLYYYEQQTRQKLGKKWAKINLQPMFSHLTTTILRQKLLTRIYPLERIWGDAGITYDKMCEFSFSSFLFSTIWLSGFQINTIIFKPRLPLQAPTKTSVLLRIGIFSPGRNSLEGGKYIFKKVQYTDKSISHTDLADGHKTINIPKLAEMYE